MSTPPILELAYNTLTVDEDVHLAPNIPIDAGIRHLRSYVWKVVPTIRPEEIILFYKQPFCDASGLIITEEFLFIKEFLGKSFAIPLRNIVSVKARRGLVYHDIYINGKKVIGDSSINWKNLESITNFIQQVSQMPVASSQTAPPFAQQLASPLPPALPGQAQQIIPPQQQITQQVNITHAIPLHSYAAFYQSPKSKGIALIFCAVPCFFLIGGLHRIYVGKVATGILQMITLGGFGIWQLIDILRILLGDFKDSDGFPLK